MSTPLLGPDGKELGAAPGTPAPRAMPTRKEKFNMVLMMFTLMDRAERQMLVKQLKPLRRRLDLMYPNGMSEADIKLDMEKAAQTVLDDAADAPEAPSAEEEALDNEIAKLSEQENDTEPQNAEVGAEQDIPVEQENEQGC